MQSPSISSPVETKPAASDGVESSSHEGTEPSKIVTSESLYSADLIRPVMEQWVEFSEISSIDPIPPVCMVMFPDLLDRIWAWEKLLPEVNSSVDWQDYKSYLLQYLQKNASKVPTGKDALRDVVNNCIEAERRLVRTCISVLSSEELCLTEGIKNRARVLLQSDDEYPAAATTLLAITREAELMCEMKILGFSTSAVRALSHQIRQAAFKLILCGGSESAAVTAAMVGLEESSKASIDELNEDGSSAFMIYYETVMMRKGIAKVLTKFGEDVACETTGNAGTLTSAMKLIRSSTELNKQCESGHEKGDKMSKSLHNAIEGQHDETKTKAMASSPDNGLSLDLGSGGALQTSAIPEIKW